MPEAVIVRLFFAALVAVSTLTLVRQAAADSRSSTVQVSVRVVPSAKIATGSDPQVVCRNCNPAIFFQATPGAKNAASSTVGGNQMIVINF